MATITKRRQNQIVKEINQKGFKVHIDPRTGQIRDNNGRQVYVDTDSKYKGRHFVHDTYGNRMYFGKNGNYEQNIHLTPKPQSQGVLGWIAQTAKDAWDGTFGLLGDIKDYNKEYDSDYKTYPGSKILVKKTEEDKQQGYWSGLGERILPKALQGLGSSLKILNLASPGIYTGALIDGANNGFTYDRFEDKVLNGNNGLGEFNTQWAEKHPFWNAIINTAFDMATLNPNGTVNFLKSLGKSAGDIGSGLAPQLAVATEGIGTQAVARTAPKLDVSRFTNTMFPVANNTYRYLDAASRGDFTGKTVTTLWDKEVTSPLAISAYSQLKQKLPLIENPDDIEKLNTSKNVADILKILEKYTIPDKTISQERAAEILLARLQAGGQYKSIKEVQDALKGIVPTPVENGTLSGSVIFKQGPTRGPKPDIQAKSIDNTLWAFGDNPSSGYGIRYYRDLYN